MPQRALASTVYALASATLMIAHQVAGKATRDALFLSQYAVTDLPKVVIAAAVLSMLAVMLISRLLAQFGPSRVIPSAFALSAACFLLNWGAYAVYPQAVAVVLYLQMAIFGAVLISGFWSVINERFDPYTAKQTIARIGAAATLGGVLGGLLAGKVAGAIDVRAMLLVLAILHLVCVFTVKAVGELRRAGQGPTAVGIASGIQLLVSHRYLQSMGLLMMLAAVMAALLDYAFKSQASARYTSGEELVAFFGQFYAAVGLATFLLQSLLGPHILKRFGIGVALTIMPVLTIGCGLFGVAVARLWSLALVRGAQMVIANSFFRSAFELLYTPLPPLTKRPTKAIIDVAADRAGDVLGSGLLLGLLALSSELPPPAVLVVAMLVATAVLFVVLRLYRGYVEQLASSLRDGAISLREDEVVDATTRHTLAEVSAATERELLMSKIRQMKHARTGTQGRPEGARPGDRAHGLVPDAHALALVKAITDLLSGDPARIRRCLAGDFMDIRLAPYLFPLLGNDMLADDVRMELRWLAPQLIGALSDALMDPDLSLAARQRIPSVLEVTHNPRAVSALMLGLSEDEFNIRYSCARALARMRERDPYMRIDNAQVFAAVEREVSVDNTTWSSRDLQFDIDLPADLTAMPGSSEIRLNYSMEHVFTLLGLVLDREALVLALRAVLSSDRILSGTALEYLENVLPEEVRSGLWPHLGDTGAARRSNRSKTALIEDLRRGMGVGSDPSG